MMRKSVLGAVAFSVTVLVSLAGDVRGDEESHVADIKITTLSTMLTEFQGVGEWGYAALIELDGNTLLFDTGARPGTVLQNVGELGIDLGAVETVFVSHNHWDHTGGLARLREEMRAENPDALSTTHVGKGIFLPRVEDRDMISRVAKIPRELLVNAVEVREQYEALGGEFVIHGEPTELYPGVWVTGPIPRVHPEKNWTPFSKIQTDAGLVEDNIPEDQALVVETAQGLVVVAGCGHAGIVNTLEYAREITGEERVHAVIGGFHLLAATDDQLAWTGTTMKEFGVQHLVGAHCTGINAVEHLREAAGLARPTAVVGAVGSVYTLEGGIQPGRLTR